MFVLGSMNDKKIHLAESSIDNIQNVISIEGSVKLKSTIDIFFEFK